MFSAPATLVGMAGVVFVVGSFIPASFSLASLSRQQGFPGQVAPESRAVAAKGDRLSEPLLAGNRTSVSIVEVVGLSHATVILRGRNGEVLYRSDPRSGVTSYSKDVDLPVITLKEDMQAPVVQHPAAQREGTEMPQDQKPKRRNPVGCIGDVSPLAKAAADRTPSLCLALLDRTLS